MAEVLKIEDLIGKVFTRLTIIEEAERHEEPNGKKQRRMLCKCSCGKITVKHLKDLRKGIAKSCGCINKEKEVDVEKENRYGLLTIIRELDKYISPAGHESRKVLCKCDCGKEKRYILNTLRKGDVTDCGCIIKIHEKKTKINKLDIEKHNNSHSSNWKIIKEISAIRDEKGNVKRVVLAKCSCGVEKEMYIRNIDKSKSCLSCANIRNSRNRKSLVSDEERLINKSIQSRYYSIKDRCYKTDHKDYKNYGARGIQMCDEWKHSGLVFREWCKTNGFEIYLQIDREDNNGNYCPENCRFVTQAENNRNQNRTVLNWEKVNKIRSPEYDKYTDKELSEMFGGSEWNIESVRHYKSWIK